jgi:hypothetical protein
LRSSNKKTRRYGKGKKTGSAEVNSMATFTLERAMKAQRGSRGIAILFFNPDTR